MGEFFKDFTAESKRIIWPNKNELLSKTATVIGMSLLVAAMVFVMDVVFSQGFTLLHQIVMK